MASCTNWSAGDFLAQKKALKRLRSAHTLTQLNDSSLCRSWCLYFSGGGTIRIQVWQLPWPCVGWPFFSCCDLSLGDLRASVLLQQQTDGRSAQLNRERPVGKVPSLGAGLWISLFLVVLPDTFSSLDLHQSSFPFSGGWGNCCPYLF